MDPATSVFNGLKKSGIDLITTVPCANLKEVILMLEDDPDIKHVPVTREEEGVGICAGAWMGGGKTAMLMQNSGLGNSINALASLNQLYGIPLLMIMNHLGVEGEPICAQVPMGELTTRLLDALVIPYLIPDDHDAEQTIHRAWNLATAENKPVAVLLDIPFWEGA
ncbi:MAG: sulfopyruvate decarboxylase subunit alpha [Methanosarcinaceae archaeon]|nr:sulfopyruvate decarboxylase subunit alpha [Methanosarcinaceae archaeon]